MIYYLIEMKLENIPLNAPLSLTINPNDSIQSYGRDGRMCTAHKKMLKVLNSMRYWSKFWVVPEYSFNGQSSKMSSGPRIHYHGVIWITDLDYFLELGYVKLKDTCMFEIDTIEDMSTWETYCCKAEAIMKPMYEVRQLPYKIDSEKLVVAKTAPKKDPLDFFPRE